MCQCKSPAEHAEHLQREKAVYDQLNRPPMIYAVIGMDGVEREVSREEFFAFRVPGKTWVPPEK